jgi:hypothetical protein
MMPDQPGPGGQGTPSELGSLDLPFDDRPTKLPGFWTWRRFFIAFAATTSVQIYLLVFLQAALEPPSGEPDECVNPVEPPSPPRIHRTDAEEEALRSAELINLGMPNTLFSRGSKRRPGDLYERQNPLRMSVVRFGGGNARSESSVSLGLQWIVRHQEVDGSWRLDEPDMNGDGIQVVRNDGDLAATALALLPLLGDGSTHLRSKNRAYALNIERAFKWLVGQQTIDGQFGEPLVHAMCTLCLCEALCMTGDPQLKAPTQRAVNRCVQAWRPPAEGFRFQDSKADDLLVTSWQVQALKTAVLAELFVPKATWKEMNHYLDAVIDPETGSYGPPSQEALGLFCRQFTGCSPRNPLLIRGVAKLRHQPPSPFLRDCHYYLHATEVLFHLESHNTESWDEWNSPMRDLLIERQDPGDNPWRPNHAGSWAPEGDLWGREFGRLGVTSLSILTLEVYYRHAPLYQRPSGAIKDGAMP